MPCAGDLVTRSGGNGVSIRFREFFFLPPGLRELLVDLPVLESCFDGCVDDLVEFCVDRPQGDGHARLLAMLGQVQTRAHWKVT